MRKDNQKPNPFDQLEDVMARLKALEAKEAALEDERLKRSEEANREVNIVSWRLDEDPDPIEAMG